jgi:hypothetical protein
MRGLQLDSIGQRRRKTASRSGVRFADALADIHDARVFGGIHFRTACRRGSVMGAQVADWVIANAMGDHRDQ